MQHILTLPADLQLQKYVYYQPRAGHTIKLTTITSMKGKFLAVIPISSSQTPSSGDAYLLAKLTELWDDDSDAENYLRLVLRGNDRYFTILVVDAGYVMESRTQPTQVNSNKTLKVVCDEEGCVLLHTSDKYHTYQLTRNSNGKIIKEDREDENPTLNENTVKFTRLLRKQQEQIHASLKSIFQITNDKKLSNNYLLPFSNQERVLLGHPYFI